MLFSFFALRGREEYFEMRIAVLQKHHLDHGSGGGSFAADNLPPQKRRRVQEHDELQDRDHDQLPNIHPDFPIMTTQLDIPNDNTSRDGLDDGDLNTSFGGSQPNPTPPDREMVAVGGVDNDLAEVPRDQIVDIDEFVVYDLPTTASEAVPSRNGHVSAQALAMKKSAQIRRTSHVRPGDMTHPRSIFEGERAIPAAKHVDEQTALNDIKAEWARLHGRIPGKDDDIYPTLSQFNVYRPMKSPKSTNGIPENHWYRHSGGSELIGLHELNRRGCDRLLFDGTLKLGMVERYVQGISFSLLSIDGYDDLNTSKISAWIQSPKAIVAGVWYQLQDPSPEYKRYHDPFEWIAAFTKYFVDYATHTGDVCLDNFRKGFYSWIRRSYRKCPGFHPWLQRYRSRDFRVVVAANIEYLWKEATDVNKDLKNLAIWKECDPIQLGAIREQKESKPGSTVVTEFVHNCFKDMYFAPLLRTVTSVNPSVLKAHRRRCQQLGFLDLLEFPPSTAREPELKTVRPQDIHVGDVVGIPRDNGTGWGDRAEIWFAYVQGIRKEKEQLLLDVIWLYRPSDTTIGDVFYPFPNELFLSDHCNCGSGKMNAKDVVGKIDVDWFPARIHGGSLVRQTYRTEDQSFITLRNSHFRCDCGDKTNDTISRLRATYQPGYSVLVLHPLTEASSATLEPCVIVEHLLEKPRTLVRKLRRRNFHSNDDSRKPNELVWTDEILEISTKRIRRPCHIRFFASSVDIPTPYDRNGETDCYFITSHLCADGTLKNLTEPFPAGVRSTEFDPTAKLRCPALSTLSIFSGGGNFDRGLEEGGALKTRWAVEWNSAALHTFRANCTDPNKVAFFRGSVDDYLQQAILGTMSSIVAKIGEVGAMAGGSPCQGFSLLQKDRNSESSWLNASKVASVAAFLDHYRPLYAVLENVPNMAKELGKRSEKPQNVFRQFISTMVAMGYQVGQHLLEAWSFGAPQRRQRLFVTIAAPNFTPIVHPPLTHSTPESSAPRRDLGDTVDGVDISIVRRATLQEPAPFKYLSAREATKDLPNIGDGHVRACEAFPDHRLPMGGAPIKRLIPRIIPTLPRRLGLRGAVNAAEEGRILPLPGRVVEYFKDQSRERKRPMCKNWSRVHPDELFATVVTTCSPGDVKSGDGSLHWEQPRPLTIMEVRRAQGFPDDEVIIGSPLEQWKIIGNSVPRNLALALGMEIRAALLKTDPEVVRRVRMQASTTETFEAGALGEVRPIPTERLPTPEVVIPVGELPREVLERAVVAEADEQDDNGSALSN